MTNGPARAAGTWVALPSEFAEALDEVLPYDPWGEVTTKGITPDVLRMHPDLYGLEPDLEALEAFYT